LFSPLQRSRRNHPKGKTEVKRNRSHEKVVEVTVLILLIMSCLRLIALDMHDLLHDFGAADSNSVQPGLVSLADHARERDSAPAHSQL
jgi:hypothetical protein